MTTFPMNTKVAFYYNLHTVHYNFPKAKGNETRFSTFQIKDDKTFVPPGMFSTDMYTKRAVETIEEHDNTVPLFLMVSFQAPHNPFSTPPSQYTKPYEQVTVFN